MSETASDADFETLATVVDADDETFKRDLGDALQGFDDPDAVDVLLAEHAETYEALSRRLATVEDPETLAVSDPEAIERAIAVIYGGMSRLSELSPAVQEAVDSDYTVNWEVEDADVGWHMKTDADAGHIEGGPTLLDEPTIRFIGSLDTMLSMLGDPEFNATLAFIQNRFELIGPMQNAREFGSMMETVREAARDMRE